jgi:hypothetical protein
MLFIFQVELFYCEKHESYNFFSIFTIINEQLVMKEIIFKLQIKSLIQNLRQKLSIE